MPLVKTPRAYIDILDATGAITGHEIEVHRTFEGEGAEFFIPSVGREPVDAATIAALRGSAETSASAQIQAYGLQIQALRDELAAALAKLSEAEAKVARYVEADKLWSQTVNGV